MSARVITCAYDLLNAVSAEARWQWADENDAIMIAANALREALNDRERDEWLAKRPSTLADLLTWYTWRPGKDRNGATTPWAQRFGDGSVATDGTCALIVAGADVTVPRADGGQFPSEAAIGKALNHEADFSPKFVETRVLAERMNGCDSLVIGGVAVDPKRIAQWVVTPAGLAGDEVVTFAVGDPLSPLHVFGTGWRAVVMPIREAVGDVHQIEVTS